ncbi:hypothetical protein BJ170DRAFT_599150 [Xylariales sp. AK1849]|nr:hypothetical protein BJ170DRAFT_599150 [Xylariales sp. AK1849]
MPYSLHWCHIQEGIPLCFRRDVLDEYRETARNTISSDVPDVLAVHERPKTSKLDVAEDTALAITYRSSYQFKGTLAFVWIINGEKGGVMITSPSGPYIRYGSFWEFTNEFMITRVIKFKTNGWDWQK